MLEFREFLAYLVLGFTQALAEAFPIDASAHLSFAREILEKVFAVRGLSYQGAIFLHLGTATAILIFYRPDLVAMWQGLRRPFLPRLSEYPAPLPQRGQQTKAVLLCLAATAVIGLGGRGFAHSLFNQPVIIGGLLIGNGVVLWWVSRPPTGFRLISELEPLDYLLIGAAQGLAVLPGVSRLGIALCAGLWRRLSWYETVKLSFLLAIPTALGASVWE